MDTAKNISRTRIMTSLAMLSAAAFCVMWAGRIPITSIEYLKYDPKDIVIAIGGFIYGPMAAFAVSAVVSVLEMFLVSSTGPIGLVMNVLSTCAFACVASFVYKRKKNITGAAAGLVTGVFTMTCIMLLWNYFLVPLYMGMPRSDVAAMLVPVFLPFNLLKGSINAALSLLLYKPLVTALRKAQLAPQSSAAPADASAPKRRIGAGVSIVAAAVLITCIFLVFVLRGVI